MGRPKKDYTGEKHITNEGYEIEIIEYFSYKDCTIIFNNGLILRSKEYKDIVKGQIKNPYHPSVHNAGYFGIGEYSSGNVKPTKVYNTWQSMIQRCYSEKYQAKKPSYKGCSVCEEWLNFQTFAKWFDENYIEGWHLDKDLLLKGNKIYSPDTCVFIPNEINILFQTPTKKDLPIGVYWKNNRFMSCIGIGNTKKHLGYFDFIKEAFNAYKEAKELHIKEVADKYREVLLDEVYYSMYNYKIEITD